MKKCLTCPNPARKRRGARYCSPCIRLKPKAYCNDCGERFAVDMMATRFRCRACERNRTHDKRVVDTFGLAPGQYQMLLLFQGGKSAIAGQRPVTKRLAVDHDHRTGEVRGLLTKHENLYIIGWAERQGDPIAVLQRAITYLMNPPARRLWGDDVPHVPEGDDGSAA